MSLQDEWDEGVEWLDKGVARLNSIHDWACLHTIIGRLNNLLPERSPLRVLLEAVSDYDPETFDRFRWSPEQWREEQERKLERFKKAGLVVKEPAAT
jgi:hypothetical protein